MGSMHALLVRNPEFLDVVLTGRVEITELLALIRQLGAVTREHGDTRMLFDLLQLGGSVHVAGQMQIGEQVVHWLPHLACVASVVPPDRITRNSEQVAQSQGVRLKIFESRADAITWLRDTAPLPTARSLLGLANAAIWDAFRHLFPLHAQAIQLPNGSLAISWSVARQSGAHYDMATPITVRLEPDLVESLKLADNDQRKRIAAHQEAAFRAGLMGYDPYAAVPSARVIVLG